MNINIDKIVLLEDPTRCQVSGCTRKPHHLLAGAWLCNIHEDRFYQQQRSKARKMQPSVDLFKKNKFYGRKVDAEALDKEVTRETKKK